jgi:hypothetical protein
MQKVSQEYKSSMKQILRNRSHMKVTIGVINQEAQRKAYICVPEDYTYFSNLTKPFNRYAVDTLYATAEQNYSPADGSMLFLPRNAADGLLNAGIVTADILGSIEVSFDAPYDIKGLTIDFGKAYPVNFTIESDNHTATINSNSSANFVTEEVFPQATFIRLIPLTMVNGQGRLRVHQITMGIGIYFSNQKILNSTLRESISPITADMPTLDFSLTVDNQDRTYDIENDASSINFLESGQECSVQFGYDIEDNVTEWVPGAKLFLKFWSADDKQMKITAVDRFDYMQGTYFKGKYYSDGISLYDLAVDVLTDAGVDSREYWLDRYLKDVIVYNPMPVVSHKEALQIIANAGRCILTQDREARIYMKSSFIPDMTASSENETYFSKVANVLTAEKKDNYATAVNNVTSAGSPQYFLPRAESGENFLNTGYVSEEVSGADGLFLVNPSIDIVLEASYKCFSLAISFSGNPPTEFIIHTYMEGEPVEHVTVMEINQNTVIGHEFSEFDKMELEFTKALASNRVMVDYIEFGEVTDYKLEKTYDLTRMPSGSKLERVKELQVTRTMYNEGEAVKQLLKVKTSVIDGEYTFNFNKACYGYVCTLQGATTGQAVAILERGAYYVKLAFAGFAEEAEITVIITGYEYNITTASTIQSLNSTGVIETWTNPLVSTITHANDLGEWIGAYMAADREYDLSYRGDPRIDSNDILFLENDFIPGMKIRVQDHTLNFNGTLSGGMTVRRIMDVGNT